MNHEQEQQIPEKAIKLRMKIVGDLAQFMLLLKDSDNCHLGIYVQAMSAMALLAAVWNDPYIPAGIGEAVAIALDRCIEESKDDQPEEAQQLRMFATYLHKLWNSRPPR